MTTITIIVAVVAISLLVHIGLFVWIRARVRASTRSTEAKPPEE